MGAHLRSLHCNGKIIQYGQVSPEVVILKIDPERFSGSPAGVKPEEQIQVGRPHQAEIGGKTCGTTIRPGRRQEEFLKTPAGDNWKIVPKPAPLLVKL